MEININEIINFNSTAIHASQSDNNEQGYTLWHGPLKHT